MPLECRSLKAAAVDSDSSVNLVDGHCVDIEHGDTLTHPISSICSLNLILPPLENTDVWEEEPVGRWEEGSKELARYSAVVVPYSKKKMGMKTMEQTGVFLPLLLSHFSAPCLSLSPPIPSIFR